MQKNCNGMEQKALTITNTDVKSMVVYLLENKWIVVRGGCRIVQKRKVLKEKGAKEA